MELKYKKIAVLGFSPRTGLELVKYLSDFEVEIIVSDAKTKTELQDLIDQINLENVTLDLNGNSDKILKAELIIISPGVPYDLEILKKARNQGIETISEIEFAYRQSAANIIAVTGTNGKTTTTEILGEMLSESNNKIKVAGNIGLPFISLVKALTKEETIILELSSFQLEAIKKFKADIAIYLNYSPDHLDRHHSEINYKKAKKNIFANQSKDDIAIINFDDSYLFELKNELKAKVYGIGKNDYDYDLKLLDSGAYLRKEKIKLLDFSKIDLIGEHNKMNLSFAAYAAYLSGQEIKKIQTAAENYSLKPHRMEIVPNQKDYLVINDSKATNPASTIKAINSIKQDIILIAGGQDRNANFDVLVEVIKDKVETLILLGETSNLIASYFEANEVEIIEVNQMEAAVLIASQKINKNKALLLSPACPSWDMFNSYKERGNIFKKHIIENLC